MKKVLVLMAVLAVFVTLALTSPNPIIMPMSSPDKAAVEPVAKPAPAAETAVTIEAVEPAQVEQKQQVPPVQGAERVGGGRRLDDAGGPDPFGYVWTDNLNGDPFPHNWEELVGNGGTPISAWTSGTGDDGWFTQTLPFAFYFYGVLRPSVNISANGNLQFGTTVTGYGSAFPQSSFGAVIDAYLMDLDTRTPAHGVYFQDFGDHFTVEWDSAITYGTSLYHKFECTLYPNGNILLQYDSNDISNSNHQLSIGIQAAGTGTNYLAYKNYIVNSAAPAIPASGTAVLFGIPVVDEDFATATISSPVAGTRYDPNTPVTVTATVQNRGFNPEPTPVSYQLQDGVSPIVTEVTPPIDPGMFLSFTFATPLMTPAADGTYLLKVWTDNPPDPNHLDDTMAVNVFVLNCNMTLPLSEGFESVTVPALPPCWAQQNVDVDSYFWKTQTSYLHAGTKAVYVGARSAATVTNDWLFTPGLQLMGGVQYQLKYWVKSSSTRTGGAATYEVMYGNVQDYNVMTNPIVASNTINSTTYTQVIAPFTPPSDGVYYIGFHATMEYYYLCLDDIQVPALTADLGVSNVAPCGAVGPNSAQPVSFRITNSGGHASEASTAYYSFDGGATTDSYPVPSIAPGAYFDVPFAHSVNLPINTTHTLSAWFLPHDNPVANDSTACSITVQRPCASCTPADVVLDPMPTDVYAGSVSANCGNAGKWVGSFTTIAGGLYHFDLCPNAPGAGTGNFDADIKICDASCTILTGVDGSCSGGPNSFLPNDFTWSAPAAGTYYVIIAPYSSFGSHNCTGTAANTFTIQYYMVSPIDCGTYAACGTPAEIEPNGACPTAVDPFVINGCDQTVYGTICPATDVDFYSLIVPPMTILTASIYDGNNCATTPTAVAQLDIYTSACVSSGTNQHAGWAINNTTAAPINYYLRVHGDGVSPAHYKLVTTCCQVTDYSVNPIAIHYDPASPNHFEQTVNTCCATVSVPFVWSNGCGLPSSQYTSGPSVIWRFTLASNGIVTFHANSAADDQIMVFTDVHNPTTTCVASADVGFAGGNETLTNIALAAGTYYVSVSAYGAACATITLIIDSDVPLPVVMTGDPVATPGDGSVTLNWATASENNNSRFELVRDGNVVGTVTGAGSSPTAHSYHWTENGLNNGSTYTYTLRSVGLEGNRQDLATVSASPSFTAAVITEYALHQNFPNPFNPTTSIALDLVESGNVSLKVYNLMGQEVANLVSGNMDQGRHIVSFNASSLSSGVYLCRLSVNGFVAEKKMLLMK